MQGHSLPGSCEYCTDEPPHDPPGTPNRVFAATLLAAAAYSDELELVRTLLEGKNPCDHRYQFIDSAPIFAAAFAANTRIVSFIMSTNPDPTSGNINHPFNTCEAVKGVSWRNQLDTLNFHCTGAVAGTNNLIRRIAPLLQNVQDLPAAIDITNSLDCFRRCHKYQPILHAGRGCCMNLLRFKVTGAADRVISTLAPT